MKRTLSTTTIYISFIILPFASVLAFDLPPVNLGFTSFLDGGPPAGPGFYFQEYVQYYSANKFAGAKGQKLYVPTPTGLKPAGIDTWVSLNQLIYLSNQPVLLGGKWAIDLQLPFAWLNLKPHDSFVLKEGDSGVGDLVVGPILQWDPIMGKEGPIFMHRFEFQMIVPTGRYNEHKEINAGSNFFSLDPYWAATVFFTPHWTASWRVHYLWNAKNEDPSQRAFPGAGNTQAGQAFHTNFASAYEVLPKMLRVGLNGYYLKQFTDTKVNGHKLSGRREQVLGLGPGGVFHFSQNSHLFFNAYVETEARNRAEGYRLNLRFVQHF